MDYALQRAFQDEATRFGLELELLEAIAARESSLTRWRLKYEPNYKWLKDPGGFAKKLFQFENTEIVTQRISWGPMQLMGATARDEGFAGYFPELAADPALGVHFAAKYLRALFDRYGKLEDAVAAYNAGSPRDADHDGKLDNQEYVDWVLKKMSELKKQP